MQLPKAAALSTVGAAAAQCVLPYTVVEASDGDTCLAAGKCVLAPREAELKGCGSEMEATALAAESAAGQRVHTPQGAEATVLAPQRAEAAAVPSRKKKIRNEAIRKVTQKRRKAVEDAFAERFASFSEMPRLICGDSSFARQTIDYLELPRAVINEVANWARDDDDWQLARLVMATRAIAEGQRLDTMSVVDIDSWLEVRWTSTTIAHWLRLHRGRNRTSDNIATLSKIAAAVDAMIGGLRQEALAALVAKADTFASAALVAEAGCRINEGGSCGCRCEDVSPPLDQLEWPRLSEAAGLVSGRHASR